MSAPRVLACTVRGCARPLVLDDRIARCAAGHSFDRHRSGYWNLLQPQDRKSRSPGDSKEIAEARRRLFARGAAGAVLEALRGLAMNLPVGTAVLDVGCGEGSILAALGAERAWHAYGLDLSAPAIELAVRAFPTATWVVANADRGLPAVSGAFDVVLSIAARRPGPELARVLAPGGALWLAVPAPDDLAELRRELHGESLDLPSVETVALELEPWFRLETRLSARQRLALDAAGVDDLLRASYRGQRARHAAARSRIGALEVTLAHELLVLRASAAGLRT